jgi:hypothetical protein
VSAAYLTVKQAGEAFPALGERFLRRLIYENRVTYYKVGARVLLDPRDVERVIEAGRQEPIRELRNRALSPLNRRRAG